MRELDASSDELPLVAIYADESCLGNGKEGDNPGAAGVLIEYQRPSGTLVRRDLWVSEPATTNNRMALRSDMNVLLPALLRASLNIAFFVYGLQGAGDLQTNSMGVGVLAWLAVLNVLLFGQLWQGKPAGAESELGRVMPLEPVIR